MLYNYDKEMQWKREQYRKELEEQKRSKEEEKRQKRLHEESIIWGVLGKRGVRTLENIASSLEEISNSLQNIEASFNTSYEE